MEFCEICGQEITLDPADPLHYSNWTLADGVTRVRIDVAQCKEIAVDQFNLNVQLVSLISDRRLQAIRLTLLEIQQAYQAVNGVPAVTDPIGLKRLYGQVKYLINDTRFTL